MTKKYIRVDIHSVDDLPKEEGTYFVHNKDGKFKESRVYNKHAKIFWLENIDWYLIEESQPEFCLCDNRNIVKSMKTGRLHCSNCHKDIEESQPEKREVAEIMCMSTILSCKHRGDGTCMICCYNAKNNEIPVDETGNPNSKGYFVAQPVQNEQSKEVQNLMDDIHKWADETFGTERTALAPLHHLQKEVQETIEAITECEAEKAIEELADCFILILNSSSKYGLSFQQLMDASKEKLIKNKARKWGKPDENGVVEHIRENPTISKTETVQNEQPTDNSIGDMVPLVWLVEKLRKREKCCTMNELITAVKKDFKGLEHVKHRTINYNQPAPEENKTWNTDKVIDFVNWYLRMCKVTTDNDCRFELENMTVIESFLKGDDYKLWWNKAENKTVRTAEEVLTHYLSSNFINDDSEGGGYWLVKPIIAAMEEYAKSI